MIHFEHPRPGEELDWLAVDKGGRLAVFSSWGWGPVPLSVATHLDQVEQAVDQLNGMLVTGKALEVPIDGGNYSFWTEPARRGFYAFDWDPNGPGPFVRIAFPSCAVLIQQVDDRNIVAAALLVRVELDFASMIRIGAAELGIPLYGGGDGERAVEMREKYFERRQIKEAIAFAEAGGIAIHRNFDSYHGSTIRGFRREKPFLHVIGLRPLLEEWGRAHGLRPEWIQPEKRRNVAHYDVFGPAAEALIARLQPSDAD